jgi:hypothetical protein
MLNIDTRYWNEIATEGLRSYFGKTYFPMTNEALAVALDADHDRLEAQGYGFQVVRAYHEVAPYLAEHEAISRYSRRNPAFAAALREILDAREAVFCASEEFFLTESQQRQLRGLFGGVTSSLPPLTPLQMAVRYIRGREESARRFGRAPGTSGAASGGAAGHFLDALPGYLPMFDDAPPRARELTEAIERVYQEDPAAVTAMLNAETARARARLLAKMDQGEAGRERVGGRTPVRGTATAPAQFAPPASQGCERRPLC